MSWRKYFTPVKTGPSSDGSLSPFSRKRTGPEPGPARSNYSSFLPDVYVGSPNRIERYGQYNTMDLDSEVNAALDILAEFTTQTNKQNNTVFVIDFKSRATNAEITVIQQYLQQWCKIQKFETRMFRIMRNIFKYGDQFFIRDPETKRLFHVDPAKLTRIIVNESEGKSPEQYVIKDFNLNFRDLVATTPYHNIGNVTGGGDGYLQGGVRGMVGNTNQASAAGGRFQLSQINEVAIDAKHVVHLSLSEGLDMNYPFGNSLLETVFKVFKQKELLEDAIIIYRVQRAPERRVFYVDVGNMPPHLAMQFVERVKTEIHQRRIPSATGGGQSVIDSAYNPLCIDLETQIALIGGSSISLREMIDAYNQGNEQWVYSCHPSNGKIVPGIVSWAGVTRTQTQVLELVLSNGNSLVCTPDHRIPVFGKGFVEAQHIVPEDQLISFNKSFRTIGDSVGEYPVVWDHYEKKWKFSHQVVREFFKVDNPDNTLVEGPAIDSVFVTQINSLPNRDVGTLSIDSQEFYHNYHTFALESGIFIKNSINEDYFFPQTCLDLNTQIKVANGPSCSLRDIINNFNSGQTQQVYSVNPATKEIEIGQVVWAGVTRRNTQIIEITLENSTCVECTLDHRFIMFDGTEVEAQDLIVGSKVLSASFCSTTGSFLASFLTVASISILDSLADTGDITVVSPSNSHNFLLDNGVFVHNSEGRGSKVETLPGGCLPMETQVCLVDGRTLSIKEIQEEMQKGVTLWTWSADPITMQVQPGIISWAGVTQLQAEVVQLEFDQGIKVTCTPDHKFPTPDQGFVRADYLEIGQHVLSIPADDLKVLNDSYISGTRIAQKIAHTSRVTAINSSTNLVQVGTLTIDDQELYHNFHTFLLANGVFTKNSNLGEIDDLRYFTNKLVRGLRIPSSYLPTGADDASAQYNDGRVGTAYIQELRFNTYCERLQNLVIEPLNQEFKYYLLEKGVNIDVAMFDIRFQTPMNFAAYRRSEIDTARIPTFTQMSSIPYLSKRFSLKRFLGLSDEEIAENERQWREENDDEMSAPGADSNSEMRSAGISTAGIGSDLGGAEDSVPDLDTPDQDQQSLESGPVGPPASPQPGPQR